MLTTRRVAAEMLLRCGECGRSVDATAKVPEVSRCVVMMNGSAQRRFLSTDLG